jgi:hypothetical protein
MPAPYSSAPRPPNSLSPFCTLCIDRACPVKIYCETRPSDLSVLSELSDPSESLAALCASFLTTPYRCSPSPVLWYSVTSSSPSLSATLFASATEVTSRTYRCLASALVHDCSAYAAAIEVSSPKKIARPSKFVKSSESFGRITLHPSPVVRLPAHADPGPSPCISQPTPHRAPSP